MAKNVFSGEGNPSEPVMVPAKEPVTTFSITVEEKDVLKKVLDRQRTSAVVHGGLKSLLSLTDDESAVLLAFLRRV